MLLDLRGLLLTFWSDHVRFSSTFLTTLFVFEVHAGSRLSKKNIGKTARLSVSCQCCFCRSERVLGALLGAQEGRQWPLISDDFSQIGIITGPDFGKAWHFEAGGRAQFVRARLCGIWRSKDTTSEYSENAKKRTTCWPLGHLTLSSSSSDYRSILRQFAMELSIGCCFLTCFYTQLYMFLH